MNHDNIKSIHHSFDSYLNGGREYHYLFSYLDQFQFFNIYCFFSSDSLSYS